MKRERTTYTVGVSNADLAAAEAAVSADSGRFSGMFSIPLIQDADPDDLDPPRYWASVVQLKDSEKSVLKKALAGIASLQYQEVNRRKPSEAEELIDAWAATYGYRRPGHILEAYGTGKAAGTQDPQSLTTTPILLDQWTSLIKLVNMDQQGQRFKVKTAGTYELEVLLNCEVTGEGDAFAKAAVNAGVIGGELAVVTGRASGKITGDLAVDDLVGIGVYSSSTATIKLLAGSKIRLRRIS